MAQEAIKESQLDPATNFMMMHAYCITYWAQIDDVLFDIFRRCVGGRDELLAILYYRIDSIRARFSTVGEIVKSVLSKPACKSDGPDYPNLKVWNEISRDIDGLSGMRRRLAHQSLMARIDFDAIQSGEGAICHLEIHASVNERKRARPSDEEPVTLTDLQAHAADLAWFKARLTKFCDELLPRHPAEPA